MKKIIKYLTVLSLFFASGAAYAQLELPRLSPRASIMQNIGITKAEVIYHRPAVRDRKIWGDLVPFNQVWRAGANEATTIEFSTDIKVNGHIVPKGKYAFYTIPSENEWTIIFNKKWDQWGLDYDKYKDEDLLHFKVKPESNEYLERMLFYFSNTSRKSATLNLAWEKLKVSFTIESYLTADNDKSVRLSPAAEIHQTVGYTDFTITFGSPEVKGRVIWGGLVPYGKVWRAGANEATTIAFTTDVKINGTVVPKGRYALFTIPGEKEWTIILNRKWKQWGLDYEKNKSEDQISFKAIPEKNSFNERLYYNFMDLTDTSATVALVWENIKVPFKVEIDLEPIALEKITAAFAKAKPDDWKIYLDAAEYGIENNMFKDAPLKWINKALQIKETYKGYYLKAYYLYNHKQYDEALTEIDKCRDKGQAEPEYRMFISQVDNLERKIREYGK